MTIPTAIFRFRPINRFSLAELVSCTIWFSAVDDFNDPFEFSFRYKQLPDTPENHEWVAKMIMTSLDKPLDEILAQIELDGWENYHQIHGARDSLISAMKTKGVCCFSAINDSILMWGHYADGHKGMVIEYDTSFEPFCKHLVPVRYSDNYCEFSFERVLQNMGECIEKIVTQKSSAWSYEEEYRMIHDRDNNRLTEVIDPRSIRGIYFGAKCDEQQREIVCRLTSHLNPRYFFAELDEGQYRVKFDEYLYTPPVPLPPNA